MASKSLTSKSSSKTYRQLIFTYGILAVLYALKYFEKQEDYTECQKIYDAVKELEKELEIELFTTITKENIQMVVDTFDEKQITEKLVVERSRKYSWEVINKIRKLNK